MHHPSRQFARGLDAKTQRVKNPVAVKATARHDLQLLKRCTHASFPINVAGGFNAKRGE
jgi:hypothetical protein